MIFRLEMASTIKTTNLIIIHVVVILLLYCYASWPFTSIFKFSDHDEQNSPKMKNAHIVKDDWMDIASGDSKMTVTGRDIINDSASETTNSELGISDDRPKGCEVMLNIVTTFPIGSHTNGYEVPSPRQIEYFTALKINMNHPCVDQIHILTDLTKPKDVFNMINDQGVAKSDLRKYITVYSFHDHPTYKVLAKYAADNLKGTVVLFMNADISLDEGFENIKKAFLVDHGMKYAYSLSRHGERAQNATCELWDYCEHYHGSHDAHLMYIHDNFLPFEALELLDYPIDSWGAENVFMYVLLSVGYKIRNPCVILKIYHNHCSKTRSVERDRVNNAYSVGAEPVDSLIEPE
ncbi:unnamed protein product [Owenia fusiformis]|uniref:Uncharacterized protein n=1 Tax=Owenia fusiformis TaxID=6347 RepID=A0A8J1U0S0_OWEFU|nr:unnamed protein product [Owenia fusiformis]